MKRAENVDAYTEAAPEIMWAKLKELRKIINIAAPKAAERISYGMPFYDYKGRLIYFASARNYLGIYIPHQSSGITRKN